MYVCEPRHPHVEGHVMLRSSYIAQGKKHPEHSSIYVNMDLNVSHANVLQILSFFKAGNINIKVRRVDGMKIK